MKPLFKVALLATAVIAVLLIGQLSAENKAGSAGDKALGVEITGVNQCIGCGLKKEAGAAAQCSVYGHINGLKVISVTADGKPIDGWKDKIIHYLPNDQSKPLFSGNEGAKVSVNGLLFPDASVLQVNSFRIKDGGKSAGSDHSSHNDENHSGY